MTRRSLGSTPSPARPNMTEEEKAYAAGLFDGEGHCRVQRYRASKNGAYYLRAMASISNTDRRCLDYVKECFGHGWVGLSDRHETHKAKRAQKDSYKFQVVNRTAVEFLRLIRPLVRVKGEQIDTLLQSKHSGRA